MNPVDHPHGGVKEEHQDRRNPFRLGQSAKGKRTRNNKRTDKLIIKVGIKDRLYYGEIQVWKGPYVDSYLLKKAEMIDNQVEMMLLKLGLEDPLYYRTL